MRYRLRTLLIVMLLGGPLCAWGWKVWNLPEWQTYRDARATVAARKAELRLATALNNGSRLTKAGERHAELRLRRDDAAARHSSILYRNLAPAVP
jgi:hypothetical protein